MTSFFGFLLASSMVSFRSFPIRTLHRYASLLSWGCYNEVVGGSSQDVQQYQTPSIMIPGAILVEHYVDQDLVSKPYVTYTSGADNLRTTDTSKTGRYVFRALSQ
ncbi:hypothetical protein F4811DRAFT_488620 [Daldinia bambusicola]|nr:hypothetical protein F4811DRAFT_488620 [Daldinia bambusicola]